MHTMRSDKEFWYKCPKPNCQSSFATETKLEKHMRIHNNDLDECQYCPYRYENKNHYERHLKMHFGIKDYKCDQCDSKFRQRVFTLNVGDSTVGGKIIIMVTFSLCW